MTYSTSQKGDIFNVQSQIPGWLLLDYLLMQIENADINMIGYFVNIKLINQVKADIL